MTEQDFGRARNALTRDPAPIDSWPDLVDRAAEKLAHASVLTLSNDEADKRRVMRTLAQISGALTAVQLKVIELEGQQPEPVEHVLFGRVLTAMGLDPEDPPTVDQAMRMIAGAYSRAALHNGDPVAVHLQRDGVIERVLEHATVYRSGPDPIVIADDDTPQPSRPPVIIGGEVVVRLAMGDGETRDLPGRISAHHVDGKPIIEADYA